MDKAVFTSKVRKVGCSSVVTVPKPALTALDIRPGDYISVKIVKVKTNLVDDEQEGD